MELIILYFLRIIIESDGALRVSGGRDALKDEFPFVVRLEQLVVKTNHRKENEVYESFCTGTAISSTWILSAGHCAETFDENGFAHLVQSIIQTIFARYNSYLPEDEGRMAQILEAILNPGYDRTKEMSIKYDFVLFRCQEIKVSRYGKVSAIEYTSLIGQEALLLGFGLKNETHDSHLLQVMEGLLIMCPIVRPLPVTMLCMVPPCQVQLAKTCPGDSGGPVMHSSGIVGVLSMGEGECRPYISGIEEIQLNVISMVSPVLDWITNIVAKDHQREVI